MYALKAPESKRQYPKRLKVFLDFLTSKNELTNSDLENQCKEVIIKSQTDPKWANKKLMEFGMYQKERVYKNQIVYATIRNYLTKNKVSITIHTPLSPLYTWVHIIENQNKFYRKRELSKMVAKLSTTIEKIQNSSNISNSKTLNEFLKYMKNNDSSERHQNNSLTVMIEFSNYFGSHTTFNDINKREQILSFLDIKIKDSSKDPEKRWITSWNHYLVRIKLFYR